MIKSITVTNFLGEDLKIKLTDPWESGFYVKSIEGLGPPKANINVTEISGSDGGEYNSARATSRNIVLQLGFYGPDIEKNRHTSYKYFPVKKKLTLKIETDYRTSSIDGYVESNEPDIFSENESNQVSIICPNPYFRSDDVITVFRGAESLFEFPYENETLEPTTLFGEFSDYRYRTITYTGDVDTGLLMMFHCLGEVEDISIYNTSNRQTMTLDTSKIAAIFSTQYGLTTGDDVLVSTIKGNRYVTLYRGGQYYNILNCIPRGSDWIQLNRGNNIMAYAAESGLSNLEFRVMNSVLYEGA